jgi:Skp family chaperone for outer membrane proteins
MIKRMAIILVIGLAVSQIASAQEQRYAFVDLDAVVQAYHRTERAVAQLEEQAAANRAERDTRVARLRELQAQYDEAIALSRDTALSAAQREESRNEAIRLRSDFDRLEEDTQEELSTRLQQQQVDEQRVLSNIISEIMEFVEPYAANQGYTAIIDSSARAATGVPVFLYTDARVDITDALIAALNADQ